MEQLTFTFVPIHCTYECSSFQFTTVSGGFLILIFTIHLFHRDFMHFHCLRLTIDHFTFHEHEWMMIKRKKKKKTTVHWTARAVWSYRFLGFSVHDVSWLIIMMQGGFFFTLNVCWNGLLSATALDFFLFFQRR